MTANGVMSEKDHPWAGKYFVEFAGRSKHNLPFPVVSAYGRIVGKVKPRSGERDDLYSVERYEFGSPEVTTENVPAGRMRGWRLFDEWRQMRLWISDVYMPAVRVEVFGGAGLLEEKTGSAPSGEKTTIRFESAAAMTAWMRGAGGAVMRGRTCEVDWDHALGCDPAACDQSRGCRPALTF